MYGCLLAPRSGFFAPPLAAAAAAVRQQQSGVAVHHT